MALPFRLLQRPPGHKRHLFKACVLIENIIIQVVCGRNQIEMPSSLPGWPIRTGGVRASTLLSPSGNGSKSVESDCCRVEL
jgi:hypothetical protein